jgi:hypothetical protein
MITTLGEIYSTLDPDEVGDIMEAAISEEDYEMEVAAKVYLDSLDVKEEMEGNREPDGN